MGRPKDDWTEQLMQEEMESLGEGARREMLDFGDGDGDGDGGDGGDGDGPADLA